MKMVHVTVQTARFEEEIAFYERFAGLTIQRDMRSVGKELVFLGDSEASTMVEVIRIPAGGPDAADASTGSPDAAGGGNSGISVGFQAEDLDAVRAELVAAGLEPTPLISPVPGVSFFYVRDPAGVNVQFIKAFYMA